jgi:hypothetical protein
VKEIPLPSGHVALIDDCDFALVSQFKWHTKKTSGGALYVATRTKDRKDVYMHRLILDCPVGMERDHINGNGLDNRRSNLRVCTRKQNAINCKAKPGKRFKGVTPFAKSKQKPWGAQIHKDGKHYWLGAFATEEEAAKAYDIAAIRLHGEYARVNFPHA